MLGSKELVLSAIEVHASPAFRQIMSVEPIWD